MDSNITTSATYLGPARVCQAVGNKMQVELPTDYAWAQSALAFPYEPAQGDLVLVIGGPETWYVIGVLQGSGQTRLVLPGDLHISTPSGKIEMSAGQGVQIKAPKVRVTTQRFDLIAKSIFERCTQAARWVKETFQLKAGRTRTTVAGEHRLRADRILESARKDVKIDGEKIDLG